MHRGAWLEALRQRDPALADDVQTLLAEHDAASAAGFLERGPDALEATHTGRVLTGPRQDDREREGVEREGPLAASLNHPHCVFVFGAGEIEGHPVIAMEVMQGTLADRLQADDLLPPAMAVDAMLQLVAGLRAAAEAGALSPGP